MPRAFMDASAFYVCELETGLRRWSVGWVDGEKSSRSFRRIKATLTSDVGQTHSATQTYREFVAPVSW